MFPVGGWLWDLPGPFAFSGEDFQAPPIHLFLRTATQLGLDDVPGTGLLGFLPERWGFGAGAGEGLHHGLLLRLRRQGEVRFSRTGLETFFIMPYFVENSRVIWLRTWWTPSTRAMNFLITRFSSRSLTRNISGERRGREEEWTRMRGCALRTFWG